MSVSSLYGNTIFGPIASSLLLPVPWKDEYPSSQEWADELELLLSFAKSQGQLSVVLPRIKTARANQRDEALNELRAAMFLQNRRFPIIQWEPPGAGSSVGEYLVGVPDPPNVFVELKSRGWESELSDEERLSGRTKLPKYIDGEGGAFENWKNLRDCIKSRKT